MSYQKPFRRTYQLWKEHQGHSHGKYLASLTSGNCVECEASLAAAVLSRTAITLPLRG